ncbi:hypothetical protein GQ600_13616 [Phytophthora cactorum]|nr:hypothetical protein GQ600_13616 [Phytophthora cactorum]
MENRLDSVDKSIAELHSAVADNFCSKCSNRNAVHEVESPNTVEELRRESPRRQLEFPKVSLTIAWELWWFGSPSTNAPPYRSLVPIDLPTIRAQK